MLSVAPANSWLNSLRRALLDERGEVNLDCSAFRAAVMICAIFATLLMGMSMIFPVDATPVDAANSLERSQLGVRYFGAPRNGGARLHAGIDLGAPDGSWSWAHRKVYAATDGEVMWIASAGPNYGQMVTVKPTGDLPWPPGRVSEVRYVHLNMDVAVRQGQTIKAGQLLGTLYSAIWPHLHFQLGPGVPGHDLSTCIDPYPVLKANAFQQPQLPKPEERKIMVQNGKMHDWPIVPTDKMLRVSNPDDNSPINVRRVFLDERGEVTSENSKLIDAGKTWSLPLHNFYGLLKLRSGGTFSSRIE